MILLFFCLAIPNTDDEILFKPFCNISNIFKKLKSQKHCVTQMVSEKLAKSIYSQWEYHMKSAAINGFGEKITFDKTGKNSKKNDYVEPKELRKNPRKIASKPIHFALQNKSKYYKGIIKNLSQGGAFIETKAKFSKQIKIKLVVLGANKYILIKCKTIHFNQTGFGVKFINILKIKKFSETKKYSPQITILKKV